MTDRDPLLAPFEALIGTWSTEAKHRLVDNVVLGTATFEWLEGGHFVVLRSHNDHELFPDAISVIGRPESGEGLVLEYFDSRGVRRTYGVSLEDGVLRWWRNQPGFDQRSTRSSARRLRVRSSARRDPGPMARRPEGDVPPPGLDPGDHSSSRLDRRRA
jgi:hypothetical protein